MAEIWYLPAGYQRRENLTFSPLTMQLFGDAWVKNRKIFRLGSDLDILDRICPRSRNLSPLWSSVAESLQLLHSSQGSAQKFVGKGDASDASDQEKHPKKWRNKQLGQLGMLTYPGIRGCFSFNPLPFSQAKVGRTVNGGSIIISGKYLIKLPSCEGKMIQWSL